MKLTNDGTVYGYVDISKPEHLVYFIRDGRGAIKIGITDDIRNRLACLQTANPMKLEMYYAMKVPSRSDAMQLEKELHTKFDKHRICGEWFKETEILAFLRTKKVITRNWVFDGVSW